MFPDNTIIPTFVMHYTYKNAQVKNKCIIIRMLSYTNAQD